MDVVVRVCTGWMLGFLIGRRWLLGSSGWMWLLGLYWVDVVVRVYWMDVRVFDWFLGGCVRCTGWILGFLTGS